MVSLTFTMSQKPTVKTVAAPNKKL
jgi:hypothetical protein